MDKAGKIISGRVYMGWVIAYPKGYDMKYKVTHPNKPGFEKRFDHREQAERFIEKQPERY